MATPQEWKRELEEFAAQQPRQSDYATLEEFQRADARWSEVFIRGFERAARAGLSFRLPENSFIDSESRTLTKIRYRETDK